MYYDPYSILFTIKLPLPLYSKSTSSLVSSECPVCYTYGPYPLWFWQNLFCCWCSLTSYWRTSSFDFLSSTDSSFAPLLYVSSSFPLPERLFPLFLTFSLTLTLLFSFPGGLTSPMALTSTSKQATLAFLSPAWTSYYNFRSLCSTTYQISPQDDSQIPQIQCTQTSTSS